MYAYYDGGAQYFSILSSFPVILPGEFLEIFHFLY